MAPCFLPLTISRIGAGGWVLSRLRFFHHFRQFQLSGDYFHCQQVQVFIDSYFRFNEHIPQILDNFCGSRYFNRLPKFISKFQDNNGTEIKAKLKEFLAKTQHTTHTNHIKTCMVRANVICGCLGSIRGWTDKQLASTLVIHTFLIFKLADIFKSMGVVCFSKKLKKLQFPSSSPTTTQKRPPRPGAAWLCCLSTWENAFSGPVTTRGHN